MGGGRSGREEGEKGTLKERDFTSRVVSGTRQASSGESSEGAQKCQLPHQFKGIDFLMPPHQRKSTKPHQSFSFRHVSMPHLSFVTRASFGHDWCCRALFE